MLDGCIVWNAHNTVFGSKRTCRLATKNSTKWQPTTARLLVMATNNSAVYLKSYSVASDIGKNATHVGRRRKFWEIPCTESTCDGNDFELIPTVKMQTINPAEGSFVSEFPVICNHCGVMVAICLKTPICALWEGFFVRSVQARVMTLNWLQW